MLLGELKSHALSRTTFGIRSALRFMGFKGMGGFRLQVCHARFLAPSPPVFNRQLVLGSMVVDTRPILITSSSRQFLPTSVPQDSPTLSSKTERPVRISTVR